MTTSQSKAMFRFQKAIFYLKGNIKSSKDILYA